MKLIAILALGLIITGCESSVPTGVWTLDIDGSLTKFKILKNNKCYYFDESKSKTGFNCVIELIDSSGFWIVPFDVDNGEYARSMQIKYSEKEGLDFFDGKQNFTFQKQN